MIESQNKQEIEKIIREILGGFLASDKYTFQKHIQMFDGRNIQTGKGTGTSIGTEITQKLSVYGETPVIQAGVIAPPTAPGVAYLQAEAQSMKQVVDALITALHNFGIIA